VSFFGGWIPSYSRSGGVDDGSSHSTASHDASFPNEKGIMPGVSEEGPFLDALASRWLRLALAISSSNFVLESQSALVLYAVPHGPFKIVQFLDLRDTTIGK